MINIIEGQEYEGQIEFSNGGNATVKIGEKSIFIWKKNTLNSLHLDTVKIKIFKGERKLEGKVTEVTNRFKTEFVGKVQVGKKSTFVVPDNNKIHVDFYIKGGLLAEDGKKVIVELTKWTDSKSPQGKITKILGDAGDNNAEMNSIMYEYNLPVDFPQEVLNESELISEVITEKEISKRKDLRGITTLTIDPVDAKDFDDALSIQIINENNIEVGIHIADVSHYVKPGTKLDEEAYKRSTSVYLVDRCVPMLPERLSNGICSLKPNEDRLAFSVIFNIDAEGRILKEWHGKTIIHSDRRFTYEEAQEIIEGSEGDFQNEIRVLNGLAQKIREKRIEDGSIEMGGIEVRFKLDGDGKKPISVYFKEQKESNKLIEEFMLLANRSVAKFIKSKVGFCINRVHPEPNIDKIIELKNVCDKLGYDFDIKGDKVKEALNKLISDVKGTPEENFMNTLIIRTQNKAYYSTENVQHYGLSFKDYCHWTSPIRRFADLIAHRLLDQILNSNKIENKSKIEEMSSWCSQREIVSSKAQRDSIKFKQSEYLLDKIGNVFDGVVSGVTDWGMYIELVDSKCEGMIRYNTIKGVKVDSENYTISDEFGRKIRLGDPIKVIVESVDLEKKQIDFKIFE
jgi:ribonuclease R